jgi:hypothetical protein
MREHSAARVGEAEQVGASGLGGFEQADGKRRVGAVRVEEIVGAEENRAVFGFEVKDGLGDAAAVLLRAYRTGMPATSGQGDDGSIGGEQSADGGVLVERSPDGIEPQRGDQACVREAAFVPSAREELPDSGIGMGAAGFYIIDPEAIEAAGDGKPIVDAELTLLALGIMSESVVQCGDLHNATS